MTTFAQALARIEELLKPSMTREPDFYPECQELFMDHAVSIVAALKAGQAMRDYTENSLEHQEACKAWDTATKGDDK